VKPRLVIAGTQSGVGKTTISIGLMAALSQAGYHVQPYKVGPDYIDPGFHTLVTGNQARNLDSYFLEEAGIKETWLQAAKEADISLIEGVMGLYDGKNGQTDQGSTAQIAKMLQAPVILVIDVKKKARSAAALAAGYKNFDSQLKVAGVIVNNVGSKRHYQMVKEAIEGETDLPVVGYLPRRQELELPERHLGLVPVEESQELTAFIDKLVPLIKEYIDLEQLMELASRVPQLNKEAEKLFAAEEQFAVDVGVAYDQAFNFYYQANLDMLEVRGANLKYFSPLEDDSLPAVDGLYLGGGFPESFLGSLAENEQLKTEILTTIKSGLPVYAECGGLMYLTDEIVNLAGTSFPMVGAIPGCVEMTDSLQAMGYRKVEASQDNILLKQGQTIKGHEFHYSKLEVKDGDLDYAYQFQELDKQEGIKFKNLLASYLHLHFGNNPQVVDNYLNCCRQYQGRN